MGGWDGGGGAAARAKVYVGRCKCIDECERVGGERMSELGWFGKCMSKVMEAWMHYIAAK